MKNKKQFHIELYEEHIAEAGALLYDLINYFADENVSWVEVAELIERILAHEDAVELGETLAWETAVDFLNSSDIELLGAIYCLGSINYKVEESESKLVDCFEQTEDDLIEIYVSAFKYAKHSSFSESFYPLLQHEKPLIRAATAETLGYRGNADPRRIWPLFHDQDDSVKITAMVAVMRLGFKEAVPAMEQAVLKSKDVFNEHCMLPLLMLGSKKALHFVQRAMSSQQYIKEQYPLYLAFAGSQQDYPLFAQALKFDGMLLPVVEALGIFGNVQSIGFLLKQLTIEDDELRLEVAKSLNMITGANLKETVVIIEQEEPDLDAGEITGKTGENKDEKKPGDSREIEIQQDCTDHQTWLNWWQNNNGRFDPNQRYRFGKIYSFFLVLEEIAHPNSNYNDRQRAYYELVIRSGNHIAFEPDWFIDKQIEALKKWQTWWNQNKTGLTNQWMFDGV